MDRNRVIALAPQYYAIAICHALTDNNSITRIILENDELRGDLYEPAYFQAVRFVVDSGLVTVVQDDFADPYLTKADHFYDNWQKLVDIPQSPYQRFFEAPDKSIWLRSAIRNLNDALRNHKITADDWNNPNLEWAPLPVERANPKLQEAIEKLDDTIRAIDADNGYNATLPAEKEYVVENLKDAATKLKKDDTISYGYLKRKVLDNLTIVMNRFGQAAVGLAAQASRDAILAWLKEIGLKVLHWLI
jgi:hypothetical protein